ncbi:alpha/beta hydrolase-fold protein [Kribbella lupini]|uniref:Esterase n=1 Tax=Kribbella lupini TaxID=291602 RepID=A0ABP4LHL1_9ACTN
MFAVVGGAPPQPGWVRSDAPPGGLTSQSFGSSVVHVYQAVGARPGAPLVVLFDGGRWLDLGITTLLDNLTADGLVEPAIVVLVDKIGTAARYRGLTLPRYFEPLLADLIPCVTDGWKVTTDPARTVVAGQSLGGLLATYLARTQPWRFGAVLAQSTSYWWPGQDEPGELCGEAELAAADGPRTRFVLSAGKLERDVLTGNRRMRDALSGEIVYREYQGGHDFACWKGELADGLIALLPG